MQHPQRVTVLPPAGREEQMERWGLRPDRLGDRSAYDAPPEHGDDDDHELEEWGFLVDGGWHAVSVSDGGGRDGGMTSHRGVLQGTEHVDPGALQGLVEYALGFTFDEVRSVYRQGPLSAAGRELRDRIDARLLAVARAGGSSIELARALGWVIKPAGRGGGQSCDTMERALGRARKEVS